MLFASDLAIVISSRLPEATKRHPPAGDTTDEFSNRIYAPGSRLTAQSNCWIHGRKVLVR